MDVVEFIYDNIYPYYMNIPQFIYCTFDGHFGCFQFGAITNRAVMYVLQCISMGYMVYWVYIVERAKMIIPFCTLTNST